MDDTEITGIRDITDPLLRARRAHQALPVLEQLRNEAIAEANTAGVTQAAIAEALSITAARVSQILKGGPGPERGFWAADAGRVTVALGGKTEAPKTASGPAGPVVALEDMAAYEALRASVSELGIEARHEIIPPPGFLDLNRPGLVVICGPRLSPMVGQMLASDRNITFGCAAGAWYLADQRAGETYRSPIDGGEDADIAYLGRLPRPDGQGAFVYIAGIHAVGAAGAVHYLAGNLAGIWQRVRDRRFSALVRCTFAPGTREITGSELIAGPYEGGA